MSKAMNKTWKSVVGMVAAVAVAATPALVGVSAGPASAGTTERAAKDDTSISIRVTDRRVEPNETSKVRGNLNVKQSDDEEGRLVTLEARPDGAAAFAAVGTATAGPHGGLKLEVAPLVTTKYRWFYPGDEDTRASRSGVARIVVGEDPGNGDPDRIKTTLSIRATDRPVDGDGESLVRGKLLARGGIDLPNREILLLARTVGNPFAVVAMSRTDRDGVARFPVSPTVKTAYRLKFEGTRLLRPSRSGVVRVGVRPVVTASAAPTTIDPGGSTTVSGLVTYEDAPYVGATVDLLARNPHRHGRFTRHRHQHHRGPRRGDVRAVADQDDRLPAARPARGGHSPARRERQRPGRRPHRVVAVDPRSHHPGRVRRERRPPRWGRADQGPGGVARAARRGRRHVDGHRLGGHQEARQGAVRGAHLGGRQLPPLVRRQ